MASLCAFLSGARRTIGYAREAYPSLLTDPVPGGRHVERIHEVEYARRLIVCAGAARDGPDIRLPVPAEARKSVDRLLERHGIGKAETVVVIHAGSVNGSAKRWPARSWSRFADELQGRMDVRIVLTGARSDEPIARDVIAGATAPIVSLVGQTNVEELVGLLARANLVASGDSGPQHLAAALGRPLVAIYGPTDLRVYGPIPAGYAARGPREVHRHDLPCSPCYTMAASAECPLGDPVCMRLVTVRQVVESAVRLLTPSPPGPLSLQGRGGADEPPTCPGETAVSRQDLRA
jgi:heptosyltransferase-2